MQDRIAQVDCGSVDPSADKAWAKDSHANAERPEPRRQSLRDVDYGELACGIRTEPDDEAAALAVRSDMRKECMDAMNHPHRVDIEHLSPIVE